MAWEVIPTGCAAQAALSVGHWLGSTNEGTEAVHCRVGEREKPGYFSASLCASILQCLRLTMLPTSPTTRPWAWPPEWHLIYLPASSFLLLLISVASLLLLWLLSSSITHIANYLHSSPSSWVSWYGSCFLVAPKEIIPFFNFYTFVYLVG